MEKATSNEANGAVKPAAVETKLLRFPLNIFQNHLDLFPKSIQTKANKAGTEQRGERTWGPNVPVTASEIQKIFDVAEALYRDKETDKPTKTYAYQLRRDAAALGEIEIKNVRTYNRKPKASATATAGGDEMHVAMAMPPRDNLVRANTTLEIVRGILRDNGQNSVATMLDSVASDIALPEAVEAEA